MMDLWDEQCRLGRECSTNDGKPAGALQAGGGNAVQKPEGRQEQCKLGPRMQYRRWSCGIRNASWGRESSAKAGKPPGAMQAGAVRAVQKPESRPEQCESGESLHCRYGFSVTVLNRCRGSMLPRHPLTRHPLTRHPLTRHQIKPPLAPVQTIPAPEQQNLLEPDHPGKNQAFLRLNSSLAFSTLSLVRIRVISRLKHIGIHRYMTWSMFKQDADCCAAPPT